MNDDKFIHSGQEWASPGRLTKDAHARFFYPCGCTTQGDGTSESPITIKWCKVHDQSHKTLRVLGDLLNHAPLSVKTDVPAYRKAYTSARLQFGRLTSSN